jgi:hypothetical protein
VPTHSVDASGELRKRLRRFELGAYGLYLLTAGLIVLVFGNDRNDWFLLLSWTLIFPFSALADKHALMLDYHPAFPMLIDETPRMIPFAFGAFFTLPLLPVWHLGLVESFDPLLQAAILLTVATAFSALVELSSSSTGIYRYHWPKRWLLAGTPWIVPIIDGLMYTLTYFGHGYLVSVTQELALLPAFALSYGVYAALFCALALINAGVIRGLLQLDPVSE